jgi:large subunit ribosomal protein L1
MRTLRAELAEHTSPDTAYSVSQALSMVKTLARVKFDPTVEVVFCLGKTTGKGGGKPAQLRGVVQMPEGLGNVVRVAAVVSPAYEEAALAAGAEPGFVGQAALERIQAGELDFECCIATPDMMGALGKVAKILGPRGLMPNPKLGTLTTEVAEAIRAAKAGRVEFRADKAGVVHAVVGKASFGEDALRRNFDALLEAMRAARPATIKPAAFIRRLYFSSTMAPSIPVDLGDLPPA